ncbi:MAG: recombinase family protein, partial [Ruminococcaceae bacterium]|nr:recombinase family protein [Oscillospiraceae bacterium]
MNITKIDESKLNSHLEQTKLHVAAYCRVSTDSKEQLDSLEAQKTHYEQTINANPLWTFAGLYFDEGITGTNMEKRPELQRLVADCENKQIDMIMTKSISRFARNTADCLELIRKLLKLHVYVVFEKENINTGLMDSELLLSIQSSLAEGESASISENTKWSIQRRFETDTYKIISAPYGYDTVNGKLVVNEEQAEIVKWIFSEVLAGKSAYRITKDLNQSGSLTRKGRPWAVATIREMISNERYIGDALFQKTFRDEHYTRQRNHGHKNQYHFRDHHEAIISREDFKAAQGIVAQRAKESGAEPRNDKYKNRYPFSSKIICGECGGTFKRQIQSHGERQVSWCCSTHLKDVKKCSMKFILNADFEYAFVTMMNKLIYGHQVILKPLLLSLRSVKSENSQASVQDIDQKLEENAEQQKVLVGLMTKGYLGPAIYRKSNNDLIQEAEHLKRYKESLTNILDNGSQHIRKVGDLLQFTTKADMLTQFDGDLFSRFVKRIVVQSRIIISFELECGLTLI